MDKLLAMFTGGPLNGLKMLVGYVLANVAAGHPLLVEAVNKLIEEPNVVNAISVLGQLMLLWGGLHDVAKKVQ